MEGKAVLFKKFAGIDVFDIEIDETDPKKFIEVVRAARADLRRHQPRGHQGARLLRDRGSAARAHEDPGVPRRPARHRDHRRRRGAQRPGTGRQEDRRGQDLHLGAGAAAIACLNILVALGAKLENIWVADKDGLLTHKRNDVNDKWRGRFCQKSDATTLAEVFDGADIFLGLSAAGRAEARNAEADGARIRWCWRSPIPIPEIMPEEAKAVRPDAMVCTGRSDYPNQVNNVLCFPFIFRGALDVGATAINEEMKLAAAQGHRQAGARPGARSLAHRACRRSSAPTTSSPTRSTSG